MYGRLAGKSLIIVHAAGGLLPFIYRPTSRYITFCTSRFSFCRPTIETTSAVIQAPVANGKQNARAPLVVSGPKRLLIFNGSLYGRLSGKRLFTAHINGSFLPFAYRPTSQYVSFSVGRLVAYSPSIEITSVIIQLPAIGGQQGVFVPLIASGPKRLLAFGGLLYGRLAGKSLLVNTAYLYRPEFVQATATVNALPALATIELPYPAVITPISTTITTPLLSGSLEVVLPSLSTGAIIAGSPGLIMLVTNSPGLTTNIILAHPATIVSGQFISPDLRCSAEIYASGGQASLAGNPVSVSVGAFLAVPVLGCTHLFRTPVVQIGGEVAVIASAGQAVSQLFSPLVSLGVTVEILSALALFDLEPPLISAGISVSVLPPAATVQVLALPPGTASFVAVPSVLAEAIVTCSPPLVFVFKRAPPVFQVFYGTLFVGDAYSYALSFMEGMAFSPLLLASQRQDLACAEQKTFTLALTEKVVVDLVYR